MSVSPSTLAAVLPLVLGLALQNPAPPTQNPPTPSPENAPTYVTKTEVDARFKEMTAKKESGVARKAALDHGNLITMDLLDRGKLAGGTSTELHTRVTEIYYVLEGSGTLVVGGTIKNAKPSDLTRFGGGPGQNGQREGGTPMRLVAGDTAIIPSGLIHGWIEIEDRIRYIIYRVDHNHK